MTIGPAIILIVVAAIAGYFLGIFDSRLTQATMKKLEDSSPKPAEAKEENESGEHTVLKVTVDPALKWHLELDGMRIEDANIANAEQRQRLVNVIVQMRPWIDGKSAAVAPATVPTITPQPVQPLQTPTASTVMPTPQQFPIASPPPKIDALRGLRSLFKNEVKSPGEMKSPSIVSMIDEVLQAKLLSSPLLSKGIRLEEGSDGEVIVYVGTSRFPGVDAVPEPEIQAIIRAAIADWEKR